MLIVRTHKLIGLSTFYFKRVAPIRNALSNTNFTVDRMSVFKHKLRNVDLKQFYERH